MEVSLTDDKYVLAFPYDPKLIEFCKNLQQARYNPKERHWTATRNVPNAIDLHAQGFYSDSEMLDRRPARTSGTDGFHWSLKCDPYQHQRDFEQWATHRARALLAADMGTGKTLMALQWLAVHGVFPERVLVVCPTSLIHNWVAEIRKFCGIEAIGVVGSPLKRIELARRPGLHVINYEYFAINQTIRQEFEGKRAMILDESHKIKNPQAHRSKILHESGTAVPYVLLLTGTPVSQGAQDYYSQFKVVEPKLLGSSFTAFKARYCEQEAVRGAPPGVKKIVGYKRLDELNKLIAPFTHTIRKSECLDLPKKVYTQRFVELGVDQRNFYNKLKREMAAWINGDETKEPVTAANVLTRLLRLSQVAQGFVSTGEEIDNKVAIHKFESNPKLDCLGEILDEMPEGESFVIMCRFRQDIDNVSGLLEKRGIKGYVIDGRTPMERRQECVDDFQAGRVQALVGQIQVAGLGLNMTRAEKMIFFSNDYSLVNRLQAEDRIHRIGATGDHCLYIDITAINTVDEHVTEALTSKREVAEYLTVMRQHVLED